MKSINIIFTISAVILICCQSVKKNEAVKLPDDVQAISLMGDTLRTPVFGEDVKIKLSENLSKAKAVYDKNPNDAEAIIWLGRRIAYMGNYRKAIKVFAEGVEKYPDDARFYRHRGHRYISTRQLDKAIADFEKAAQLIKGTRDEIEPDGAPNARNIPTSTLHSNIWYHLGLAFYLKADFDNALEAYKNCMDVSKNPDMLVATSNWYYITLKRMGRDAEAEKVLEAIHPDMDIIENGAYYNLLLLYKGFVSPVKFQNKEGDALGDVSAAYGLANYYFLNNDKIKAKDMFKKIVSSNHWAAFGYIAAEAELNRF